MDPHGGPQVVLAYPDTVPSLNRSVDLRTEVVTHSTHSLYYDYEESISSFKAVQDSTSGEES